MKKMAVVGACVVLVALIVFAAILVGSVLTSAKVTVNGQTYTLVEYREAVNTLIAKSERDVDDLHLAACFTDPAELSLARDACFTDSAELTALLPPEEAILPMIQLKDLSAWVNRPDAELVTDLKDAGFMK